MKNKILWLVASLTMVALLFSMVPPEIPVSAGTLLLSAEGDLEAIKAFEGLKLAPAGLDIVSLAVKGKVIYAATGSGVKTTATTVNALYKSVDTGATWSSLARTTDFPTVNATDTKAIKLVAVAPDDDKFVVIVATDDSVYYSSTGGSSWSNLYQSTAGFVINSIDISVLVAGIRYVAAGGQLGGVMGVLYTLKLSIGESWRAQQGNPGFTPNTTTVGAVKFSPNFATDKLLTVVSANTSADATHATFQIFRLETGAETWNGAISFVRAADWGTGVRLQTIKPPLLAVSIALPPSYLGTSEGDRNAFVGLAASSSDDFGGGVWRLADTFTRAFTTWNEGSEGPIGSLAYHSSGKLLAGDWDKSQVYRSITPLSADPRLERVNIEKQPGGVGMVQVAYADNTTPVAGTSGDESAFATSTDDGNAFNDTSLIDTTFGAIDDVAVSADGTTVYLATSSVNDASVWLKEGTTWTRVFSRRDTANVKLLIRLAPADTKVAYVGAQGSQDIWVSHNSGKTSWTNFPVYRIVALQDFAVFDATTVYALDYVGVSKTTYSGASWAEKKSLDGLTTGYMITLAPNGDVLVGTTSGDVAFSKDGGTTFYKTTNAGTGTTQVIADSAYATNNIIYAIGSNGVIRRGTAVSTTQTWSSRGPTLPDATWSYTGAARFGTVIYALANSTSTSNSRLYRALNLTTAATSALAEWGYLETFRNMTATPQALKVSTTGPKFWMASGNRLYSATDPIATEGPTMVSPAEGFIDPVNAVTGRAYNISFTFNRLAGATSLTDMRLQIATDAAFTTIIADFTKTGIDSDTITMVIGPTAPVVVEFMPGYTYYWRTRIVASTVAGATNQLNSPWSEIRSFRIQALGIQIALKAGWNMIGSVSGTVDFTQPEDNPDGSVMPFAYWWDPVTKSYINGTTIEVGKGYWVAAIRDCTLTLSPTSK